jgi:hypothetical protein
VKRLSILALIFAILSAVFFLLLVFLRTPFPLYPLMSYQDAADIFTPLVLIAVYWLLFKRAGSGEAGPGEQVAFAVLAAFWASGHGMHLSANSINNLIEGFAGREVVDVTGTSIYQLSCFYDEQLSHYLWHTGILGLAGLLIYREWRRPAGVSTIWWVTILAGVIYGFTYFCTFLEGGTVLMGLPFAVAVTLLAVISGRGRMAHQPLLAFFCAACLVAVLLFAGWGLFWGGFPEFTDVGLI